VASFLTEDDFCEQKFASVSLQRLKLLQWISDSRSSQLRDGNIFAL